MQPSSISFFSYPSTLTEQCHTRDSSVSISVLLAFTLCTSAIAFFSGYYSRDISKAGPQGNRNESYMSRVYSLISRAAREQYAAFSELCDGVDGDGDYLDNANDDSDTETENEPEVETPRAAQHEATDYFGPTMSRRRKSDAGMEQVNVWSSPLPLDRMVLNWTTSAVDDVLKLGNTRSSLDGDLTGLRSPQVIRDMYEVFKGGVAHIVDS